MREQTTSKQHIVDIRCDHDGLKMAEIKNGHLILRSKHHGETHIKIVSLAELGEAPIEASLARDGSTDPP